MARSNEDRMALEHALSAIDANLQTLLLARTVILQRLRPEEVDKNPFATMGGTPAVGVDGQCQHANTESVDTMGQSVTFCQDCGDNVG